MGIDESLALMVFTKYEASYRGELQGCCLVIADEIQQSIGGEVVAGYLTWFGGSCRRGHWWVEKEGTVYDPMGDSFLESEQSTGRESVHRDRAIFDRLLLNYEQYRVTS